MTKKYKKNFFARLLKKVMDFFSRKKSLFQCNFKWEKVGRAKKNIFWSPFQR